MTVKDKIIHRVSVNTGQGLTVPQRGSFALRRSRLVRRRFRLIFYSVGFLLSLAAIGQAGYGFLMETPYFIMKQPRVEGVSEPLRKEILGLVASLTRNNHNLLSISAAELEEQIARHPRLRDIHVEKVYPDQLNITAVERQEAAIAVTGNGFYLLDNNGHVMDKLDISDLKNPQYPFISGLRTEKVHEGEPIDSLSLGKALNLLQVLEARNVSLYNRISEVEIKTDEVSPLETLTAHMKSGLDVKFGDSNPVDKLPEFETLLDKLKAEGVKPFEELVYIDLRFDDLGVYMDKETALDVARNQLGQLQQGMEEATADYARKHANDDDGDQNQRKPSGSNSASRESKTPRETSAAPQSRTNHAYPRSTRQSQQERAYGNYRQPSPQYYPPQQYYQQRQNSRTRQSAPMYNLPANQQRY